MPPKKKQRTGENTATPSNEKEQDLSEKHKEPEKKSENEKPKERDVNTIPDDEYVCKERPLYDYKLEANSNVEIEDADEDEDEEEKEDEEETTWKKFQKEHNDMVTSGKMFQPAEDRPDWKWTMLWAGWKVFREYESRANYCDPDRFGMYIYNDWWGYGMTELLENMVLAFDEALKKEKDGELKSMWGIVSAISLWLVEIDQMAFMNSDDGDRTIQMCGLLGNVLLRALAAVDHAGELKAGSILLDLPIVITTMLEWSSDLEDHGVDTGETNWRPHAIAYYKKAGFDASKGIANTKELLESEKATKIKIDKLPPKTNKNPWAWTTKLNRYKKQYATRGGKIGGRQYDITKMSRAERAKHAFDGKDPLKDIPESALINDELDIGRA